MFSTARSLTTSSRLLAPPSPCWQQAWRSGSRCRSRGVVAHPRTTTLRRWYQELAYAARGDPLQRLVYATDDELQPEPPVHDNTGDDWMLVQLVAAPCNPADLNVVQGKYPSPHGKQHGAQKPTATSYLRPNEHQVGGAEALGRIIEIRKSNHSSSSNSGLVVGDSVVLAESGWGSWRSYLWVPSTSLLRVPPRVMEKATSEKDQSLSIPQVALISQVAGTAYRLLQDFGPIQPGDVVLQNAGTSAVSMCVAELMRILHPNCHLVSFVRRKEEDDEWSNLVNLLTRDRTTPHTIMSEETAMAALNDKETWREWKAMHMPQGRIVLGLNSVHGPQTSQLFFNLLADDAKLVTYGAMSQQALPVPAAPLIFRNISLYGYWHSRWMVTNRPWAIRNNDNSVCPRQQMFNELCRAVLIEGGMSLPPVHAVDLSQASNRVKHIFDAVPTRPLRAKLVWNLQK